MRESKLFAQRSRVLSSDEVKRKYFLVFEGSDTELIYFNAVSSKASEIGIHPLIDLVPIIRSYSEQGWSNPVKLLERIIQSLYEAETGYLSYESLLNRIMDYLQDEKFFSLNQIQASTVWKLLIWICKEKLQVNLAYDVEDIQGDCSSILEILSNHFSIANLSDDIISYIKSSHITYDPSFDKICIVADRDKESFTAEQYHYVMDKCQAKGFGFYITNPCFEFWLLLHFEEVFELNRDKLLLNPKVSAKRRYTEQALSRIFPGYHKSNYHAEELISRLDHAIHQESFFCEDPQLLENELGCNLGILFKILKAAPTE